MIYIQKKNCFLFENTSRDLSNVWKTTFIVYLHNFDEIVLKTLIWKALALHSLGPSCCECDFLFHRQKLHNGQVFIVNINRKCCGQQYNHYKLT